MAFSTTDTEITYTGDGVDKTFAIPFDHDPRYIRVRLIDLSDPDVPVITDLDQDTDYTVSGGEVVLDSSMTAPSATDRLYIFRETTDTRPTDYNTYQFPYPTVNAEMDRISQRLQEIRTSLEKKLELSDEAVFAGKTLTADEIVDAIEALAEIQDAIANGGAGLPAGGVDGDFIQKLGTSAEWVPGSYEGFSARFNENFSSTSLDDTIRKILNFAYLGPLISLGTSPSASVREKGAVVSSVTLNATTTKRSDPITAVRFYRNAGLINTVGSPNANGGLESYTDNTPFSDNVSFYAQVDDGTTTVTSNTVTFPFVYPYYVGVGAQGLNAAGIAALTKLVIASSASVPVTTSPTSQVFYFAQPAAYPVLTSILDPNGFETIGSYLTRLVTITGLDGTAQSYRVYELSTPTTQVNFTNTYKR